MNKKRGGTRYFSNHKSQAAMEYLMIAGIAFVITVPMMYILYSYTSDLSQDVAETKLGKVGGDMANAAEQIFYLGAPSRTTLRTSMPESVYDMDVTGDNAIRFHYGSPLDSKELNVFANVNIIPYLLPEDLAKGRHDYRIEAERDHVIIYTGNKVEAEAEGYAYLLFKRIMGIAKDVVQQPSVIRQSGNQYIIDENYPEDVAYLEIGVNYVNVNASIIFHSIDGEIDFTLGGIDIITNPSNLIWAHSLEILAKPDGFTFSVGGASVTDITPWTGNIQMNKKYLLNITQSTYSECTTAGLCNIESPAPQDNTIYYLFIIQDGDHPSNVLAAAFVDEFDFTPSDIWPVNTFRIGEKNAVNYMFDATIVPFMPMTREEVSATDVKTSIKMLYGFKEISVRDGLFFNITMVDENGVETGLPVSFDPYYSVSMSSSMLNIDKDSRCDFSIRRSGQGIALTIGPCPTPGS